MTQHVRPTHGKLTLLLLAQSLLVRQSPFTVFVVVIFFVRVDDFCFVWAAVNLK
jgi:hypothetical protein